MNHIIREHVFIFSKKLLQGQTPGAICYRTFLNKKEQEVKKESGQFCKTLILYNLFYTYIVYICSKWKDSFTIAE